MILAFSVWDIIRVPFGYLLDWLYQATSNYGVSLILFSILLKLIMLPVTAKSKKSMMAMSRLAPLTQALQAKYADDPTRANQEVQKLYKDEGVSMTGGCLWSLVPLLILIPLYTVIREPLNYMLHYTAEQSAAIVDVAKAQLPELFGKNDFYSQLIAAAHLDELAPAIVKALPELANTTIKGLNFDFLGIDLGQIPEWKVWTWTVMSWNLIGGVLIPILSAASNVLTMLVTQKLNATVTTDEDGNVDEAAVKQQNSTNAVMTWMMPLMTLWIGFSYPAALSVYWLTQGIVGVVMDVFLTKHYKKIYADEDEIKRRAAKARAEAEAEKERVRAQRRAENPDGITENTSKKKLARLQKAQNGAEKQSGGDVDAASGDAARPYSRGRAYDPNRYSNTAENHEE